ncbi:MAG: Cof-type HAD-IIB family hydrolase [Tenericutes bacterium]|nr:Cof-type HAD-IIB family hydrolase [Mycoplasmatota bacterium]
MNNIHAIFTDLDGTLLNDEKEIGNYTKEVIKKYKNDINIIPTSARSFNRIKPYLEELGLLDNFNYTICFNGALIVNNQGVELFSSHISKSTMQELTNLIDKYNIEWMIYTKNELFKRSKIEDINKFIRDNDTFKLIGTSTEEKIDEIRKELSVMNDKLEITTSMSGRLVIVNKGSTKATAVEKIMVRLNIGRENIIAIGDGENDIEMIKNAGYGVAMLNAPEAVKKTARMITKYTNNEDGVGKIIEEILN